MDWFVAAIVSAVVLSGQLLAFQQLQKFYPIRVYMTYIWLGAALMLAIVFLRPEDVPAILTNLIPLIVAGLSSWGGIYALNQAMKTQTNLGYIEAVMAIRIVITYIISLLAFQAPFDLLRLVGIIAITLGVLAVAGTIRIRMDEFKLDWLPWALTAGVMFALMTIFVRFATDGGVSAEVATVVVLVVAGIAFLAACRVEGLSLRLNRRHLLLVGVTIAFATVGNAAEFISFEHTPNLAYSIAIDNTRMIILYIIGLLLFSEKLQRRKAFGVILTFAGVLLLS
ncbi:MAG: EamA family transporter [Anaerolineae bacterium]|nr:EamA family transporter [Anaerolineae bacterium]